jgi:hypothetical protein
MIARIREYLRKRSDTEARRLARQTEEWLKDETFNTGLAMLREGIIEKWLQSDSIETREACWFEIHRVNALVKSLRIIVERDKVVQNGEKLAEKRAQSAGPQQADG